MGDKRAEWIIRKDWSEVSQRLKLLSREGKVDVVRSAEVENHRQREPLGRCRSNGSHGCSQEGRGLRVDTAVV